MLLLPGAGAPAASSLSFAPTDDAYVRSNFPAENTGAATTLRAYRSGSTETRSYLRFVVSGASGSVPAKLRLRVTDASGAGGFVYRAAGTDWSEGALTWASQPGTIGSSLGALGPVTAGDWVELGVGPLGNGTYAFALAGASSDAAFYASGETATPPELVLGAGGVPAGSAPASASPPRLSAMAPERGAAYAQPGSWTGSTPISFGYQWRRCDAGGAACTDILGADQQGYALGPEDVGSTLRVAVTATSAAGNASALSAASAPVPARPSPPVGDPVIAAVGDIACSPADSGYNGGGGTSTACRQKATSGLVADAGLSAVLLAGDLQYQRGEYANFLESFDSTWGRVGGTRTRRRETTSTRPRGRSATTSTSVRLQAIRRRATTASTSAPGTWSR